MIKVFLLCLVLQASAVDAQFGLGWLGRMFGLGGSQSPSGPATELDQIYMDAPQLITSKGYPCESHFVTTEDGYNLGLHRIPYGPNTKDITGPRPVVLIQHGLLGSSNPFLLNPPDQNLPFILADAGVDVWLGNNRGNPYSKSHVTLNPNQREFWDFSWDEMIKYDLPAEIDYILQATGNEQLYYIGYSQGTALGFGKFSEDQEFAKKIKHFIAMAPVAHVGHITSPLKNLVRYQNQILTFLNVFAHGSVSANPTITKAFSSLLCSAGLGEDLCMQGLSLLFGRTDGRSIDKTKTDLYNAQAVTSTSAKVLVHWAQGVRTNRFQHFDHGPQENMRRYGQAEPPLYVPSDIQIPVSFFTGGNDALADPTDVAWLKTQINVVHHVDVPWYNHLGPVLAYDAKDLMYPTLVPIITGKPWSPSPSPSSNGITG